MTDSILSRYNAMKPSSQKDIDNQPYPDVLSLDFNAFNISIPPFQFFTTETIRHKPYLAFARLWGAKTAEGDDIVLTINNVPHKDLITEGNLIIVPVIRDVINFINVWKLKNGA